MPCIVQSVNWDAMTIEAQSAIQGLVNNVLGGIDSVNMPLLLDVPIVFPSAGGFTLTLPIVQGDEVLVVIANRCIDAWWQNGAVLEDGTISPQRQMELRMHDLSDGFAIPGPRSIPNVLGNISATNAQLRNDAGTTYLEITHDGKIKLVSASEIDLTASSIKLNGSVEVMGDIDATGAVTGATVNAGLISLANHTHAVTTAPGTTGPALP